MVNFTVITKKGKQGGAPSCRGLDRPGRDKERAQEEEEEEEEEEPYDEVSAAPPPPYLVTSRGPLTPRGNTHTHHYICILIPWGRKAAGNYWMDDLWKGPGEADVTGVTPGGLEASVRRARRRDR
ncbi:hypothetical protein E2C01_090211 [Portunus trituberculatus]|uniref:Uncharacterized protein n=1 Tax=Portunus trituberculatus TaxID=210409 RepID=A0A5B7JJN1_PORTR|nr:hypothetical protein [Portunus trituberculatus]